MKMTLQRKSILYHLNIQDNDVEDLEDYDC